MNRMKRLVYLVACLWFLQGSLVYLIKYFFLRTVWTGVIISNKLNRIQSNSSKFCMILPQSRYFTENVPKCFFFICRKHELARNGDFPLWIRHLDDIWDGRSTWNRCEPDFRKWLTIPDVTIRSVFMPIQLRRKMSRNKTAHTIAASRFIS